VIFQNYYASRFWEVFLSAMNKTFPLRFSALALLLGACGSNLAFLSERSRSEALALQEECGKAQLQADELAKADGFMDESAKFQKDGKAEKARLASEEAIGLYRVALARDAQAKAEKEFAAVESTLVKDKERLATYKEILDEMKTMRKP